MKTKTRRPETRFLKKRMIPRHRRRRRAGRWRTRPVARRARAGRRAPHAHRGHRRASAGACAEAARPRPPGTELGRFRGPRIRRRADPLDDFGVLIGLIAFGGRRTATLEDRSFVSRRTRHETSRLNASCARCSSLDRLGRSLGARTRSPPRSRRGGPALPARAAAEARRRALRRRRRRAARGGRGGAHRRGRKGFTRTRYTERRAERDEPGRGGGRKRRRLARACVARSKARARRRRRGAPGGAPQRQAARGSVRQRARGAGCGKAETWRIASVVRRAAAVI